MNSRDQKMQEYAVAKAMEADSTKDAVAAVFSSVAESGGITHDKAAEHPDMFDEWKKDTSYAVGNIRRDPTYLDGSYIFSCRQPHTSQEIYPPHIVPAIWERIPKPGEGSHDNPFIYDPAVGAALVKGKFYLEDETLYECIRDSGVPIYGSLAGLINNYVVVSNNV